MFGIGTVARLAGVSVRTLRYYDEVGLLRPAWVDPNTGYRWYAPEQIRSLHRIVALRDLGVRLVEIAVLLDDELSVEELRGIFSLRRAEAHDRLAAEGERLARVEARLAQLEGAEMTDFDVVVKRTEPEWVLAITEPVESLGAIGPAHARLWPQLHRVVSELGIDSTPPSIAVERGSGPIEFTAALIVPDGVTHDNGARTYELPGLQRAATTVMRGDDFDGGFRALRTWITDAGEREAGELREIYLDCDGPRDTWIVELQLALADREVS
jgi:DNA-binding transcriptional MerR regulator